MAAPKPRISWRAAVGLRTMASAEICSVEAHARGAEMAWRRSRKLLHTRTGVDATSAQRRLAGRVSTAAATEADLRKLLRERTTMDRLLAARSNLRRTHHI